MIAMALYTLACWGVTAAVAWRCWKKWRRGADQLRAGQWDALSLTLLVMVFPTIGTLGLLHVGSSVTGAASTALLLASGACYIARSVATRRADTATRTIRAGLGLPVARRLLRTSTVAALWLTAAFATMLLWIAIAAVRALGHRQQMTAAEPQTTVAQTNGHALTAALVVIAVGALHCLIQQFRHGREQQRVRAVEQHYLTAKD
ncbi:hypothetical protein ABR738_01055 [Streptomyces sp. Edi4]|uniref:hypothetical protein n=1 Tax=Streptomyces sp. Edi4 TaxID=3162527 RepID=UPI003305D127